MVFVTEEKWKILFGQSGFENCFSMTLRQYLRKEIPPSTLSEVDTSSLATSSTGKGPSFLGWVGGITEGDVSYKTTHLNTEGLPRAALASITEEQPMEELQWGEGKTSHVPIPDAFLKAMISSYDEIFNDPPLHVQKGIM